MKWTMANDFTVTKRNEDDGSVQQHVFTSHAQARQFMEKVTGQKPPSPHKPTRPGRRNRAVSATPIDPTTAQQAKLKEQALKQFKGL